MDLNILYEDEEILVAEKPVGIESQSARSFEPDMVSEVKKHINTLSPKQGEPYVGVIHRLDKPVGGVMVYAKTKKSRRVFKQAGIPASNGENLLCSGLWKTCGKLWRLRGLFVERWKK